MIRLNRRLTRLLVLITILVFLIIQLLITTKSTGEVQATINSYKDVTRKYSDQMSNFISNAILKQSNEKLKEEEMREELLKGSEIKKPNLNMKKNEAKTLSYDKILELLTFKDEEYYNDDTSAEYHNEIVDDQMDFYKLIYNAKIDEPRNMKLVKKLEPDEDTSYQLANATLITLVRNSELEQIVETIKQIESTWNHKYHYPYTFMNEEEFSKEFKEEVGKVCSGKINYAKIPSEVWSKPANIDPILEKQGLDRLIENNIQYATMESYHNMCRFNSAHFYNLDILKNYKYYWRFEPGTNYYCNIDYDIFKFMSDNNKIYGFTISLYDNPYTVETLFPSTLEFLKENPQYVNKNGAFKWITEDLQNPENTKLANGYSTCHFWSNFEIGDMDFYRGEAYSKWMEFLEAKGGFYYERWGDAPVHSLGLALFADKSKIHWFRDIGYFHSPYFNCPNSDKCAGCQTAEFAPPDVFDQNCLSNWIKYEMTKEELFQY